MADWVNGLFERSRLPRRLLERVVPPVLSREWTRRFGTVREKEKLGLLMRPHYAYGLLRAADMARFFGVERVVACEFGVAGGGGLLNLCELAELISREVGVGIDVVGFDTGAGLPPLTSFKDHPELWSPGDFPMVSRDELLRRLEGRARVVFGNLSDTIGPFTRELSESRPLGFIALDVDVYSGAASALEILSGPEPDVYLPALGIYCDDTRFYFANRWCGELAAIAEFNDAHALRKIDVDRTLPDGRPPEYSAFARQMYVAHVLDHPLRRTSRPRKGLTIEQHAAFMNMSHV